MAVSCCDTDMFPCLAAGVQAHASHQGTRLLALPSRPNSEQTQCMLLSQKFCESAAAHCTLIGIIGLVPGYRKFPVTASVLATSGLLQHSLLSDGRSPS